MKEKGKLIESPELLAQRFHEAYERLASKFGYRLREGFDVPWAEVPENNRHLMTAVCTEILEELREAESPRQPYITSREELSAIRDLARWDGPDAAPNRMHEIWQKLSRIIENVDWEFSQHPVPTPLSKIADEIQNACGDHHSLSSEYYGILAILEKHFGEHPVPAQHVKEANAARDEWEKYYKHPGPAKESHDNKI